MYDELDDYYYPAENNYHEDRYLQEAEDFYYDVYGDEDYIYDQEDDDYNDLLNDLEYPF